MSVSPRDLAETLRRRAGAELAEEARRREAIRSTLFAVFGRPERRSGPRAWLIGSLTGEHWGRRSDVDVVVDGSEEQARKIRRELEAALGARVDLLRLAELPEGFRRRVLDEGETLS